MLNVAEALRVVFSEGVSPAAETDLEHLLRFERRLGPARKLVLHLGGLFMFAVLYPALTDLMFWAAVWGFFAVSLAYVFVLGRPLRNVRLWWYASFAEEIAFVAFLVWRSGGHASEFVLLYPAVMVGVAASRPGVLDFLVTGFLGHVSYAAASYLAAGGAGFYLTAGFWFRCGMITAAFVMALVVVDAMYRDRENLRRTKAELERATEELAAANAALEKLAVTDGLTGLYNHRYFQQRLREEIARAQRTGGSVSLAMLDVDYFKCYNDANGHQRGDEALTQIGRLIKEIVRCSDVPARYGGEEFAVILPDTDAFGAGAVAERIRRAVEVARFAGEDKQPGGKITVSVGVACYPRDARNADELIQASDCALYLAKNRGRNTVVVCSISDAAVG